MTSVATRCNDFFLTGNDVSMVQLHEVMSRTGTTLDAAGFIEAVSCAFQDVQAGEQPKPAEQRFRLNPSFAMFQNALRLARETREPAQAICVLGCGRGFAGKTAEFAV